MNSKVKKELDNNKDVIFCYKYVWQQRFITKTSIETKSELKTCIKFVTGVAAEHNIFISTLCENENVLAAAREYQWHYDLRFANEQNLKIKEVSNNETNEY